MASQAVLFVDAGLSASFFLGLFSYVSWIVWGSAGNDINGFGDRLDRFFVHRIGVSDGNRPLRYLQ